MKKILPALVLLSLLAVLLIPVIASAAVKGAPECCELRRGFTDVDPACTKGAKVGPELGLDCKIGSTTAATTEWGTCCLYNTIYGATDWIFTILIAMVVIMVLIGAIQFLTAAGEPEKVTSGRNYIMYALIGLAVAFLAKAIPGIFKTIIGI